jgi:DNA-binding FrmR family transcriptional regulator
MKNKKTVLNHIESVRLQVSSLKKRLEEKTISEEIARSVLNKIESKIDSIENLIDLEDENF